MLSFKDLNMIYIQLLDKRTFVSLTVLYWPMYRVAIVQLLTCDTQSKFAAYIRGKLVNCT